MKKIQTVGVVGAGTMGSALAQKFAQEGFRVILADREMKFVEKGLNGIRTMLKEGIDKKVFTPAQVDQYLSNLQGTDQLEKLSACDIIIEAIFEDFKAKSDLFKTLSAFVPAETILATNTSSFSVTELSASVTHPERFVGLHYFYHAAKNRLVEIIPGKKTSSEVVKSVYRFSCESGKDPIYTADTYGFAINRFFVPWLNESVKLLDEGIGTADIIDSVCMKAFGIGMGPFALMNATGVPIALHAQRTLEFFGPSYKPAAGLIRQVDKKENWKLSSEAITSIDPELETAIRERMMGCVYFVCSQILQEKVCTAVDLNKGSKIGLKWRKGPVDLMNQSGDAEVKKLVEKYGRLYSEKIPLVSSADWKMEWVTLEIKDDRAVITMNRPEDLNALNEEVMKQLDEKFTRAEKNPDVKTIFLTGTGKAFVAGADIKFFVKNIQNKSLNNIVSFTRYGQEVLEKIDKSRKKVVALLNGMALGGGMELALCADVILATPKTMIAFPETGIGIYPGLGGTQRSTRRVGKGLAKYLILTGKMLGAREAAETGLIDGVYTQSELFNLSEGLMNVPVVTPPVLTDKWKKLADLYTKNGYQAIISGQYSNGNVEAEVVAKLGQTMKIKAPIAMRMAEELIEAGKGPASELEKLTEIFSTFDALKGLSNIGKKVEYEGR